jgi:hypothetical protein
MRGAFGELTINDSVLWAIATKWLDDLSGHRDYIAIFAFIACLTASKARLQAISGHDLQANPSIAVQLRKVELLYDRHLHTWRFQRRNCASKAGATEEGG